MKLFRSAVIICIQNIRKWRTNYRVWIIAILMLIFVHSFTEGIRDFTHMINDGVSPWIYPFLYNDKYIKLLFFFPIILLFCDAPFIDENQPYIIMRCSRIANTLGQALYIIVGSGIYVLFLIITSITINIPNMVLTSDWGKVLGTLANTNASKSVDLLIGISKHIISNFTPLQAMWFSFLLAWLCCIFLGLLIYVINVISNTRILGMFAASLILVFSAVVSKKPELQWFSPVSWTSLNYIDIGKMTDYPTIQYIMTMNISMIIILVISSIIINKKKSILVITQI